MTPIPPSSPDGSPLPPRHRPPLGNLAKDTTELDLWAFEDDLETPGEPGEVTPTEIPRVSGKDIPALRGRQQGKPRETEDHVIPKTPTGGEDRIRMNISRSRSQNRPAGQAPGHSNPESDFDDLENWEDVRVEPQIEELPAEVELEMAEQMNLPKAVPNLEPMPITAPVIAPIAEEPVASKAETDNEFSPVVPENATPISLRPHLGLSKLERIGLIALVALLLAGGLTILVFSLNRLPTESDRASANDFPIKGGRLTISSATSYWRAPILDGPTPDTFRRGTQLLPVLELTVSGGPAAIRVLFRNDEQTVVGDAVTRAVRGGGTLKIPATAGFDDLGMHAAYRTGESKPWTIEVYEAPSEETAGREFKKLFEMNVSTDRR